MSWEVIAAILGGVVALGGWLIEALKDAARKEGARAEQVRQMQEDEKAKQKADAVLGEHRDPRDVDDRLRGGTF